MGRNPWSRCCSGRLVKIVPFLSCYNQILNRHRVLQKAQNDLATSSKETNGELESYQSNLQRLQKEKTNEILVKNSEIARLMKILEIKTDATKRAETEVQKLDVSSNESVRWNYDECNTNILTTMGQIRRLAQLQMSIKNLYQRIIRSYEGRKISLVKEGTRFEDLEPC